MEKLKVMNSQMGLRPACGEGGGERGASEEQPQSLRASEPQSLSLTSVIGVSMMRLSPYFFHRPRLTCTGRNGFYLERSTVSTLG
ncbi:hypothetical protein EYF80_051525 [Liparis tanakae]|uniref:Uncharacterized protein n=1 Tax=Liparis tanakae TaxID=230148 RepID=A0A4Z2FAU9_9TELE|nr:hypothetical protein EYF80_051525 [Liparis tanakae]